MYLALETANERFPHHRVASLETFPQPTHDLELGENLEGSRASCPGGERFLRTPEGLYKQCLLWPWVCSSVLTLFGPSVYRLTAAVSSGYKVKTFPYPSMEADTTPDEEEEDNSCCTRLQGEMFKWLTSLFAAHVATPHSPTSPLDTSSSATMSPLYPDRPIRPMPKRSIKARLSSEVADTIDYPPAPASSNNMFYSYPDSVAQRNGAAIRNALREIDNVMYGPQDETELDDKQSHRFKGNDPDSEDEGDSGFVRHYENYQHRPGIMPAVSRASANGMSRNAEAVPRSVASSADSADGYDSFENTNNKKKRKIPTSGNAGNHHSAFSASLSQDLANMGLSNGDGVDTQEGSDAGLGHYYGSGSAATSVAASGTGISGAGRGRFGRSGRRDISGRGPLTSSMNSSNAWQNGRFTGLRRDQGSASSFGSKGTFVIKLSPLIHLSSHPRWP